MPCHFSVIALALIGCLSTHAHAQSGPETIQTDRPDFVESSNVVGKGRVQLETSFAAERLAEEGGRSASLPTLLRIGTGENWEVRVETDGPMSIRSQDAASGLRTRVSGFADLAIGVKWHGRDQAGAVPSLALLAHADLASGAAALRGKGTRPSLRLVAEWELPAGFSLGAMPGLGYDRTDDGRHFYHGIWGVVLGKSWDARLRTFAEFAMPVIAHGRHGGSVSQYNMGAAYLLTDDSQLDLAIQRGANRHAPDRAWTIGFSTRF